MTLSRSNVPERSFNYPKTAAECLEKCAEESVHDTDAAWHYAEKAVELDPLSVRAYRARHATRVALQHDDRPSPVEQSDAEELRPTVDAAIMAESKKSETSRNWEKARAAVAAAIRADWTRAWVWSDYGLVLEEEGNFEEAENAQSWAISLENAYLPARDRYVKVEVKLFNRDHTQEPLDRALEQLRQLFQINGGDLYRGNLFRARADVYQRFRELARIRGDKAALKSATKSTLDDLHEAQRLLPPPASDDMKTWINLVEDDR